MNMNAQIRNTKSPNVTSRDLFNLILTTNPIQFPATYPAITDDPMYDHILYGNDYITGNVMYINPYERMMTSFKEMDQNILNTVIKIDQNLDFITHGLELQCLGKLQKLCWIKLPPVHHWPQLSHQGR
ncbi:MAG: hypothetical protein ACLTGI_05320 [Hoylesella buccalis]